MDELNELYQDLAVTFAYLMKCHATVAPEHQPEFDWLLDRLWPRLPVAVKKKVAAGFSARMYEVDPSVVTVDEVAPSDTLAEIAKHPEVGLLKLSLWEADLIRATHIFDPQVVNQWVYRFRREMTRISRYLGHSNSDGFFRWLETSQGKAEVKSLLEVCEDQFKAHFGKLEREYTEPISARRMRVAYERGFFAQEPIRVKFWHFLKTNNVKGLPELHTFVVPPHSIELILKDLYGTAPKNRKNNN
jgi:hypothetical protein